MFNSYALTVQHEEGDSFLQILFGDKVLATVGEPSSPGGHQEFCVWSGTGLDADDEEATPLMRFYTKDFRMATRDDSVEACWQAAVRSGYFVAQGMWSLGA